MVDLSCDREGAGAVRESSATINEMGKKKRRAERRRHPVPRDRRCTYIVRMATAVAVPYALKETFLFLFFYPNPPAYG